MNQEVKSGKILSATTPWTDRTVPGIHMPDQQQTLKATFTEPTIECPECHALVTRTAKRKWKNKGTEERGNMIKKDEGRKRMPKDWRETKRRNGEKEKEGKS